MSNWDDNDEAADRFDSHNGFADTDSEPDTDQDENTSDEETSDIGESAAPAGTRKPQRRRGKSASITRGQALQVLETYRSVQEASADARAVLRAVVRADDGVTDDELTAAVLSQDRTENPLATLSELRESLAASPFTVPAIIAGMEKAKRNRAFAVLSAATGADDALPAKDVEAAGLFAQRLSELTDAQIASLDEAHDLGR